MKAFADYLPPPLAIRPSQIRDFNLVVPMVSRQRMHVLVDREVVRVMAMEIKPPTQPSPAHPHQPGGTQQQQVYYVRDGYVETEEEAERRRQRWWRRWLAKWRGSRGETANS